MPSRTTRAALAAVVASLTAATLLQTPATAATAPETVTQQPTTHAATLPPLSASDQRMVTMLTRRDDNPALGRDLAGVVTDAASTRVLYAATRFERQLPASTAKLLTAVNVLQSYGPAHRFTTTVRKGRYWSQVTLVGGGDPSLSSRSLDAMAAYTATALKARGVKRVAVYVDDSLFPAPSLAYGWKSTYVPGEVRPVRALVVNQHQVWDTSIDAGKVFAGRLAARGLSIATVARARAVSGSPVLAASSGRRLDSMVGTMLRSSDNDYAEAFHRLVALKAGYPATWSGAAAAQRSVLRGLGVDLGSSSMYDGSGLSRADRLTPQQLAAVLTLAVDGGHPRLVSLPGALPLAGRSGTLAPEFKRYTTWPTSCAAGNVQAKTGSLSGVVSLAGYARGADGRTKVFAFLLNGVPSTLTTRQAVDRLATTITGCW